MSDDDRYLPLADIDPAMVPPVSAMIPPDQKIRVKQLLFAVQSINDKKGTVTFTIEGVFPPSAEDVQQAVRGN